MSMSPEVRCGGGLPFGQMVSQWVCDPRYTTNLRTLYLILASGPAEVDRSTLATRLGVSIKTVDRTIREGECAGLFRVELQTDPTNPQLRKPSTYHVFSAEFLRGEWVDPLAPGQAAVELVSNASRPPCVANSGSPGGPANGVSKRRRLEVLARDGYRCLACGTSEDLTMDHIKHRSRGGRHNIENLRTLCRSCNSRRGAGYLPGVDL